MDQSNVARNQQDIEMSNFLLQRGDVENGQIYNKTTTSQLVQKKDLLLKKWQIFQAFLTFANFAILLAICIGALVAFNHVNNDYEIREIREALTEIRALRKLPAILREAKPIMDNLPAILREIKPLVEDMPSYLEEAVPLVESYGPAIWRETKPYIPKYSGMLKKNFGIMTIGLRR